MVPIEISECTHKTKKGRKNTFLQKQKGVGNWIAILLQNGCGN